MFRALAGFMMTGVLVLAPGLGAGADPYLSRYDSGQSGTTLIHNVTLLDGRGGQLEGASILLSGGKVAVIGESVPTPDGSVVINGTGRWVTPGIIDVHSHIGTSPTPEVPAHQDGNERGEPNTADVWVLHTFWPQGPGMARAIAGGVTTFQILPGSSNVIGGRSAVLKNVARVTGQEMLFPDARLGVKMACGENPKKNYQSVPGAYFSRPGTRMGVVAHLRQALYDARAYAQEKAAAERAKQPFAVDLAKETLADLLAGRLSLQVHCYRADDMAHVMDVAAGFGVSVAAFHHAVESYKIRESLAASGTCIATWADRYGGKMEMFDGIPETAALVHAAGGCAIIHSDSDYLIQRLNQEAAKALMAGRRMGLEISKAEAWQWLSLNPAQLLGIDTVTGTLEAGKNADVVLWSGDPFSVYTKADRVWVDGVAVFDRADPTLQRHSDFELSLLPPDTAPHADTAANKNRGSF